MAARILDIRTDELNMGDEVDGLGPITAIYARGDGSGLCEVEINNVTVKVLKGSDTLPIWVQYVMIPDDHCTDCGYTFNRCHCEEY